MTEAQASYEAAPAKEPPWRLHESVNMSPILHQAYGHVLTGWGGVILCYIDEGRRIVQAVNAWLAAQAVAEHLADHLKMGDCGICGCGNDHIPECPEPSEERPLPSFGRHPDEGELE